MSYDENTARRSYGLLHHHARNGYERGDCHCEACDIIVTDLADYFGFTPEKDGRPMAGITGNVYDPAALVREAARERGWDEPA